MATKVPDVITSTDTHKPYVSAKQILPEITIQGIILAFVLLRSFLYFEELKNEISLLLEEFKVLISFNRKFLILNSFLTFNNDNILLKVMLFFFLKKIFILF